MSEDSKSAGLRGLASAIKPLLFFGSTGLIGLLVLSSLLTGGFDFSGGDSSLVNYQYEWEIDDKTKLGLNITVLPETSTVLSNTSSSETTTPSITTSPTTTTPNNDTATEESEEVNNQIYKIGWAYSKPMIDNMNDSSEWNDANSFIFTPNYLGVSQIDLAILNDASHFFIALNINHLGTVSFNETAIPFSIHEIRTFIFTFALINTEDEIIPWEDYFLGTMTTYEEAYAEAAYEFPKIDMQQYKKELWSRVDQDGNGLNDNLDKDIAESVIEPEVRVMITCEYGKIGSVITLVQDLGGQIVKKFTPESKDGFYGLTASISKDFLTTLTEHEDVILVEKDLPLTQMSDDATRLTQVRTTVWDTLGYTGDSDASIAILDSGFDDAHPMLSSWSDKDFTTEGVKMVGWYDATADGATEPQDYGGHGSHCAGIAAGRPYNATTNSTDSVTTNWSYTFVSDQDYTDVALSYYINMNKTGAVKITYYWQSIRGTNANQGEFLYFYAPNGTRIANAYSAGDGQTPSNPMSVELNIDVTGIYRVALGFSAIGKNPQQPGIVALTGINIYPYEEINDGHSRFSGVAPDTKIVGIKTFDNTGSGTTTELVDGLQWLVTNAAVYHVTVASMSLGFPGTVSAVDTEITNVFNKGVLPIIAAGNSGQGAGNQIYSPCIDEAVLVAASGDYDKITDYSSEGPGIAPNTVKPDIAAPGGVSSQGAYLSVDTGDSDANDGYDAGTGGGPVTDKYADEMAIMQGTSMACPHVAGIAALLTEALGGYSSWIYDDTTLALKIKHLMLMSGHEIYDTQRGGKDKIEGWGRINADAAINMAISSYTVGNDASDSINGDQFGKKVWGRKVALTNGNTYTFALNTPEDIDLDVFLYYTSSTPYGDPEIVASSINPIAGGDEGFTYTANTTGNYYITVKYVTGDTNDSFTLSSEGGSNYPTATINSPAESSDNSDSLTIQVTASAVGAATVSSVEVMWAKDAWVTATDNSGTYEYTINTTILEDYENYTFLARVTDSDGKVTYTSNNEVNISNSVVGSANVLLVDDDAGATYEQYYQNAIADNNIGYETILSSSGSLTSSYMSNYDAVIWFTGDDYENTITGSEQDIIDDYLDTYSGNLFISGPDIGYYFGEVDSGGETWLNSYLHADYLTDNGGSTSTIGVSSDIFDGKTYSFSGGDGAGNTNYLDTVAAVNSGVKVMNYASTSFGSAIKYSGSYKVLYFAFGLETIGLSTDRADAMNIAMTFLGVSIDNIPAVSITSPTTNLNDGFFSLTWSASDDVSISYSQIFVDGVSQGIVTNSSVPISLTLDREHTIRVVVFDSASQKNVDVYTFTVDGTAPTISNIGNSDTISELIFSADVTDDNLDTVLLKYRVNSGSWTTVEMTLSTGDTFTYSLANTFGSGDVVDYYIVANDTVNNVQTDDNSGSYYSVTVYNAVPVFTDSQIPFAVAISLLMPFAVAMLHRRKRKR